VSFARLPLSTFRDLITTNGDTLGVRYDNRTIGADNSCWIPVQSSVEYEFDDAGIATPELLAQPTVRQSPLCNRDALYGGRTEIMLLHYKAREGETIQYVDVMNLYPYICKYFKFRVGHPVIHVGEGCNDNEDWLRK